MLPSITWPQHQGDYHHNHKSSAYAELFLQQVTAPVWKGKTSLYKQAVKLKREWMATRDN